MARCTVSGRHGPTTCLGAMPPQAASCVPCHGRVFRPHRSHNHGKPARVQACRALTARDVDNTFNKCSSHDGVYGVFRTDRSDAVHTLNFVQFVEALRQLAMHFAMHPAWPAPDANPEVCSFFPEVVEQSGDSSERGLRAAGLGGRRAAVPDRSLCLHHVRTADRHTAWRGRDEQHCAG